MGFHRQIRQGPLDVFGELPCRVVALLGFLVHRFRDDRVEISRERLRTDVLTAPCDRAGRRRIVQADGGTLFLDEICDMPIETQNKILRVLVEQRFERVGGGPKVQVDVRVISSTSRDDSELLPYDCEFKPRSDRLLC